MSVTPGVEWRMRGDELVDLESRELAALAGLSALGDLDLELVGVGEIIAGDAEASRGDLLDGRAFGLGRSVGVLLEGEARGVFAALAGVGTPADAVHGQGEGLVGLGGERAQGHRAGAESFDDLGGGFDFFEGEWLGGRGVMARTPPAFAGLGAGLPRRVLGVVLEVELEQAAEGAAIARVVVAHLGERLVGGGGVGSRGGLERGDGGGVDGVLVAVGSPVVIAGVGQLGQGEGLAFWESQRVASDGLL